MQVNSRAAGSAVVPAVVMGLSPTGLYAVRELGRAGISVTGMASSIQAGSSSRYLAHLITAASPEARLKALLDRFPAQGEGASAVLIPTSDEDIAFIASHQAALGKRFAFQASYTDGTAETVLTKERFYALCEEMGIAYPRLWKSRLEDIGALRGSIKYPCLIKPSRVHEAKALLAGKKGWVVSDEASFDAVVAGIPQGTGLLLLQEIVPGPESAITLYAAYFDQRGEPQQAFTARKVRQYPPGFGSASLVCSQPEPESQAIAERLLRSMGYKGIAAAEFKRDPRDGVLKIIEVNARPSLWFALTSAAGKQLALAAYQDLSGAGKALADAPQVDGVWWRFYLKDLYSAVFYKLKQDFVLPAPDTAGLQTARAVVYAVFAKDDPAPVFADALNMARKLFRPLINRMKRNK